MSAAEELKRWYAEKVGGELNDAEVKQAFERLERGQRAEHTGLRIELETLLTQHGAEEGSNTPTFILAELLAAVLRVFDRSVRLRADWFNLETPFAERSSLELDGAAMPQEPLPGVDPFMSDADLTAAAERIKESIRWERLPILMKLVGKLGPEKRVWHELVALSLTSLERNASTVSRRVIAREERQELIASIVHSGSLGMIQPQACSKIARAIEQVVT